MFSLLCRLASHDLNTENIQSELNFLTVKQWEALSDAAYQHGLGPLVYQRLKRAGALELLPPAVFDKLRQGFLVNTARNLIYQRQAAQLLQALSEQGIPAIALKGIYLVEHIYEDISLRVMSDVDIMVKKEHVARAIAAMQKLGYQTSTYFDTQDSNRDVKHVPPMSKPGAAYLEVHYALLEEDRPFSIDIPGLWQRAVPAKIGGVEALALSVEDLLLHLCIHMTYQHRFNMGLRGLVDVLEVLRHYEGQVDWDVLHQRAEAWGAGRVLAVSLALLHELFSAWVPEWVESDLQTDPEHTHMMEVGLGILRDPHPGALPVTPDLADFGSAKAIWKKTNLILKRIFIPKMTMARLYNISPKSWKLPFYYLLRFLELLKTYSGVGWRLLRRESLALEIARQESEAVRFTEWLTSR